MRLPRIMHVKADLLYCICNIWTSEGQIPQGAGEAAKIRRICNWNTIICRKLRIGVDWSGTRLAISHTSSLKNIHHILSLRE